MLTEFEINEAHTLLEKLDKGIANFVFDPDMSKYIERLAELSKHCEHQYDDNGKCIYCGHKEVK